MAASRSLRGLVWLCVIALSVGACVACDSSCRLRFCGGPAVAYVGAAGVPSTPSVCGPAEGNVRRAVRRVGLTKLRLQGDTQFKAADQLGLHESLFEPVLAPLRFGGSALALSAPIEAEQRALLHGACARVPVVQWGDSFKRSDATDCVAFRVRVADIRIDLEWDSRDDLDVFVIQPDGKQVFFQSTSDSGRLLRDDNRRACGRDSEGGLETVVYDGTVDMLGTYRVFAEHSRNCGEERATRWRLRVAVRGQVVSDVSGSSELPLGGVIDASRSLFNVSV